jgi:hypothetical protein
MNDIRRTVWVDGTCKFCGYPTLGTDSHNALPEIHEKDPYSDYYVWCSNYTCNYYCGECIGDMECPPDWATHDLSWDSKFK